MNDDVKKESWWEEAITRREANLRLAKLGTLAALLSVSGITQGCDSDEGVVEENDALELQKKEGWNVGATTDSITLPDIALTDSKGSLSWSTYLEPSELLKAYEPKRSEWRPFVVATLAQSLSQPTLKAQIKPILTPEMKEAYSRGLGMRELIKRSNNPENILIVVDLDGKESVALAAAMSEVADIALGFDNYPHPKGVVKSHEVLGALVYYAAEVEAKKEKRPDKAATVFLLDNRRLNAPQNPETEFDNRYVAKLPSAEKLQALGVKSIVYVAPSESQTTELDDLNDDFATFKEKGIPVTMLAATSFKPTVPLSAAATSDAKPEEIEQAKKVPTTETLPNGQTTNIYHYGGSPFFFPWFFWAFPMFVPSPVFYPSFNYGYYGSRAPARISRPTYEPVRRPTLFSSRSTGGLAGIGKTKPSGFGRVSTNVSRSGTRSLGTRSASRSGSWGRSGGFFGG
ncbi:MAG: hypothetical protein NZM06_04045 [Chloroherpetonaceae bacterium]|nr:hypothetical protein [Chloroherpetonaceae bacterium]MDW8438756.1 hypothetical protein [Chloroherpetonaceae bacterium]